MAARTTINQSNDATAADYRYKLPIPSNHSPQEIGYLKSNTKLLSIHHIDTTIKLNEQRAGLDADDYIELAILGCEAFLGASNSLGASAELKRFVRRDELPKLKQLMVTKPVEGNMINRHRPDQALPRMKSAAPKQSFLLNPAKLAPQPDMALNDLLCALDAPCRLP